VGPFEGPYSLEQLRVLDDLIQPSKTTPSKSAGIPRSAAGSANNYESQPRYLQSISERCGQIRNFRETLGLLPEPLWHACLGVAAFCEDGRELGHDWSKGDARYNEAQMQEKLTRTGRFGPTTCEKFHGLDPKTCEVCPHWQKIKSPISLGRMDKQETEAVPTNPAGGRTATSPRSGDAELDAEILRLSGLAPALYEHERKVVADKFDIRTTVLDKLVNGVRDNATDERQGHALQLTEVEPWPDAVDGGDLLHDIVRETLRYVVMAEERKARRAQRRQEREDTRRKMEEHARRKARMDAGLPYWSEEEWEKL
jgi:hypothetical protein